MTNPMPRKPALDNLRRADPETYAAITRGFAHWDDIDIHFRGRTITSGGHGFSEVLYAFSSAGNNNGSAFAGLGANTPFYNTVLGLAMLFARYWLALPVLDRVRAGLERQLLARVFTDDYQHFESR